MLVRVKESIFNYKSNQKEDITKTLLDRPAIVLLSRSIHVCNHQDVSIDIRWIERPRINILYRFKLITEV